MLARHLLGRCRHSVAGWFGIQAGGVDQLASKAVEFQPSADVIAGCARCGRYQRARAADERVEQAAFASIWFPDEHHARRGVGLLAAAHLIEQPRDGGSGASETGCEFIVRNEADVFFREIESRLQIGQKIEQLIAQRVERTGQTASQLGERRIKLAAVGCVDHAEHGLSLHEIDSPGEKCPQREFARLGQPRPALHAALTIASKSGGEPNVCNSAVGCRV